MREEDRRQCPNCGKVQYLSLGGHWYHVADESEKCETDQKPKQT